MATAQHHLSTYDSSKVPSGEGKRFAVITADWNEEITYALRDGCLSTLAEHKAGVIDQIAVPGAVELTFAASKCVKAEKYDAVIVIGCVIRGETAHFDFVCQSITQGVTELNLKGTTPVIFCVLTDNHIDQSRARSGGKHGNKGIEAAIAALQMSEV